MSQDHLIPNPTSADSAPAPAPSGHAAAPPVDSSSTRGYFRLDSHHDQLVFGTEADIENNIRFKMIQMRKNKVANFRNYNLIPISEKEIPKGLLEAYMKK